MADIDSDIDNVLEKDTRNIYLTDDISQDTVDTAIQNIIEFNQDDDKDDAEKKNFKRKPIHVFISSYGGDVYAALGLGDIIRTSQTPVYTYCMGKAMSAGLLIYCTGHKRFLYKYSTLMFHSIATFSQGKLQTIIEDVEECKRLQKIYNDIVCSRSKLTHKVLNKVVKDKKDWFIGTEEAVKLKLCDEVLQ